MASKTRIALLGTAAILLAGCAAVREQPAPAAPAAQVAPAPAPKPAAQRTTAKPKAQTVSHPALRKSPQPGAQASRSDLPAVIGSGATWAVPGKTVIVNRGVAGSTPAVPLFRQAGVLASVRAAVQDSPAQPQAEFRRGVLTLTFNRGSNDEIAAAVNKALSIPEARKLQVSLQP